MIFNSTIISCKDKLPKESKYVLGYCPEDKMWNVICLSKGISKKQRAKLKDDNPRKKSYESSDEHGNNHVAYHWKEFGPKSYFGQDITHWMELPKKPKKDNNV